MKWLAKLFYRGRIKRLERTQYAAALLAQGETAEAAEILERARPRSWVDDVAVYHFVTGKLRMEQGLLDEAEMHLHTAVGLGLERPAVKLNLAVLAVRRCALGEALALLDEVELSDDASLLEQCRVMREVIAETQQGVPLPEIATRAARFRKKHLTGGGDPRDAEALLKRLTERLQRGSGLSSKDREDAALLYGTLLVQAREGRWLLGLEPRDHRVLVQGVLHHPAAAIDALLGGEREALELPAPPPALPEGR